ncbi:hypothetical protein LINPERPRIM_LOCUS23639 [Linum perenne]
MIRYFSISQPPIISSIPNRFSSLSPPPPPSFLKSHFRPRRIVTRSSNGDDDINRVRVEKDPNFNGNDQGRSSSSSSSSPFLPNINWGNLFLNPDPDNLIAVGLTGLLTWASVQLLWQLFTISLAILVAALKYSFIAALLIFILITLL